MEPLITLELPSTNVPSSWRRSPHQGKERLKADRENLVELMIQSKLRRLPQQYGSNRPPNLKNSFAPYEKSRSKENLRLLFHKLEAVLDLNSL